MVTLSSVNFVTTRFFLCEMDLQEHTARIHGKCLAYVCPYCDQQFASSDLAKSHMDVFHVRCIDCDEYVQSNEALVEHVK